jgi:hypothetical protein
MEPYLYYNWCIQYQRDIMVCGASILFAAAIQNGRGVLLSNVDVVEYHVLFIDTIHGSI